MQVFLPIPITIALQPSPSVTRHEDNKKQSASLDFLRSFGSPVRPDSFEETSLLSIITQSAVIISPHCIISQECEIQLEKIIIDAQVDAKTQHIKMHEEDLIGTNAQ